ncbi:hypothetical protein HMPREF1553_01362, partial [Porphyromonas gingivalis F0568]
KSSMKIPCNSLSLYELIDILDFFADHAGGIQNKNPPCAISTGRDLAI